MWVVEKGNYFLGNIKEQHFQLEIHPLKNYEARQIISFFSENYHGNYVVMG
jgi:hypothetical protein